jgi:hypothetical protein
LHLWNEREEVKRYEVYAIAAESVGEKSDPKNKQEALRRRDERGGDDHG